MNIRGTGTDGGSLASVTRHDYLPFGEDLIAGIRVNGGTGQYGYEPPPDGVRQKFTGYERDTETSLDFAQARYYASIQGRFTSIDPLSSPLIHNPQNWNRYAYVLNNPLSYTDPDGLIPKCMINGVQVTCTSAASAIRSGNVERITYSQGGTVIFVLDRAHYWKEGRLLPQEDPNSIQIGSKYFDQTAWEAALNSFLFYFGQKSLSSDPLPKWPGFTGVSTGGGGATDDWGPPARTLSSWLRNNPQLLQEVRNAYRRNPEWWGIDPDNDQVFYRDGEAVKYMRNNVPGERGGHHPFALALGGGLLDKH